MSRAFSSLLSNVTLADAVTTVAEFTPGLGLALEIGRGVGAAISGDYAGLAQSAAIIGTSVFTGGNTGVAKLAILTAVSVTKHAGKVTRGADKTIYRMGTSKESKTRLGRKAQEAEDAIGSHGVSGSTTKPSAPCSSASCASLEAAGFKVKSTPTRRDPNHVTIELPKPVTKEVADKFNNAFDR